MTHLFEECLEETICFSLIFEILFVSIFQKNNFQNNMIKAWNDNEDFVLRRKRMEAGKVTMFWCLTSNTHVPAHEAGLKQDPITTVYFAIQILIQFPANWLWVWQERKLIRSSISSDQGRRGYWLVLAVCLKNMEVKWFMHPCYICVHICVDLQQWCWKSHHHQACLI